MSMPLCSYVEKINMVTGLSNPLLKIDIKNKLIRATSCNDKGN